MCMLVRKWQNIKFTTFYVDEKFTYLVITFLCQGENLHIKFITLLSVANFFNESTYLLIKFLVLISSFLYLYGVQFFPYLHNFVEGIKNICQVYSFINQEGVVMTWLKEPRWSTKWRNFWNYFVVVQPKRCMFGITRWGSSGVPIEKIETIWTNFARYVSTPNRTLSSPRGNQTWSWAAYECAKAVVSAGFR